MTTITAEQIIRIGGNEWTSPDGRIHRVYLDPDVWMPLIGLEVERYKSGNIQYAWLRGSRISNSEARRIIGKVYWEHGRICVVGSTMADEIRDAIAQAVAASEPKTDDTDHDADGDTTTPATPAEQVTALREAGRTVREIAEMIGCSVATVYRWLRGQHRPSARYAAALAAITA